MVQALADAEVLLARGTGELVPGTDELAIIAAVNAIADGGTKFHRDAPRKLDGEVGNAAPRIEAIGRDDGPGGAGRHAGAAGAAVRGAGFIDRQLKVEINFAEEKIRPGVAVDQVRVLADPAQAGIARQVLFQHRRAVGKNAVPERTDFGLNALAERLKPRAQHLVIIPSQGIARHIAYIAVGE